MVKHNRTIEVDGEEISVVYDDEKNLVYQGSNKKIPDDEVYMYDEDNMMDNRIVAGGWVDREGLAQKDDTSMSVFLVSYLKEWIQMVEDEFGEAEIVEVWSRNDWPTFAVDRNDADDEAYCIGIAPRTNPLSDGRKIIEEYQPDEEECDEIKLFDNVDSAISITELGDVEVVGEDTGFCPYTIYFNDDTVLDDGTYGMSWDSSRDGYKHGWHFERVEVDGEERAVEDVFDVER